MRYCPSSRLVYVQGRRGMSIQLGGSVGAAVGMGPGVVAGVGVGGAGVVMCPGLKVRASRAPLVFSMAEDCKS